ncbi:MAG: AI-2E family transporter [Bacteroidetes bacterium]|nr:MAG: AI-2E family transporter [Bacteroidota bacterium]
MDLTPEESRDHFQRLAVMMLGILCVLGLAVVLIEARSLFVPFVMAIFLLYMLNPLITVFENRGIPGGLAGVLSLLIAAGVMATLGRVIGASIQEFAENYPRYQPRIQELTDSVLSLVPGGTGLTDPNSPLFSAFDGSSIPGIIAAMVGSIGGFASETFLVLLILAFMLAGRNQLIEKIPFAFAPATAEKLVSVMKDVNGQIQQYLVAKSLLSLLTAGISMIILYLFGIEFVLVWGVLTFVLNFIPNIGSIIATLLPLSLAVIQLDGLVSVVWLGICLMGVQFLIGNILDPKYVGNRIGISPVTILFALVAWSWMWGLVGMFLAVPLTVLIKIILENIEVLRPISVLMGPKPTGKP